MEVHTIVMHWDKEPLVKCAHRRCLVKAVRASKMSETLALGYFAFLLENTQTKTKDGAYH